MTDAALAEGREALARRDWARAYQLLAGVDPQALASHDLAGLADAAWAMGDYAGAQTAHQRAHDSFLREGDKAAAARAALAVAGDYFALGDLAVARGWRATAERLLEDEPEGPAHAHLAYDDAYVTALLRQDHGPAAGLAREAAELARRVGADDVEAAARNLEGRCLALAGEVDRGMVLIDETMALAMTGRLPPPTALGIACLTISTCQQVADTRRAAQWIEAYDRATTGLGLNFSPDCRIHRAVALRDAGSWARAEAEAHLGCADPGFSERFGFHAGWGWSEVGQIRLRLGDLDGAEAAFVEAHTRGYPPHPGLALVHLARGDVSAARGAIVDALGGRTADGYPRVRLLEAAARIAVAASDLEAARSVAAELAAIAERLPAPPIRAALACVLGTVALAEGAAGEAAESLREAVALWHEEGMPYDAAQARLVLGRALHAGGAPDAARLEVLAARSAFARLGAVLDEDAAGGVLTALGLQPEPAGPAAAEKVVRAFMFTDIVRSTALAEAMGDDAWRVLLRRHDTLLDNCVRRHGGTVVKHEGDGVFAVFRSPANALDCATAIQEDLERRRAETFIPLVRIGVHHGRAIEDVGDYFGTAVNTAARIMALAEGGEVVATAETIVAAGRSGEPTEVRLKGLSGPIAVVRIA